MPDPAETTAASPPGGELGEPEGRPPRPRARERGRMRRRLRQQKRIREALLLDLGALVYELHRHSRREPELLQAKAAELSVVDQEVRALADALEADESVLALVAAGIAGSCENCGSLLSTDARYCAACGAPAVPAIGGTAASGGPALTEPEPEPEPELEPEPEPFGEYEPEEPLGELSDDLLPDGGESSSLDVEEAPALDDETVPEDEPVPRDEPLEDEEPLAEEEPLDDFEPLDDEPLAPWLAEDETQERRDG